LRQRWSQLELSDFDLSIYLIKISQRLLSMGLIDRWDKNNIHLIHWIKPKDFLIGYIRQDKSVNQRPFRNTFLILKLSLQLYLNYQVGLLCNSIIVQKAIFSVNNCKVNKIMTFPALFPPFEKMVISFLRFSILFFKPII